MLLPLNGHTVIAEVISRCRQIVGIDQVICAIPENDDRLAREIRKNHCVAIRGPEEDVLKRYVRAAEKAHANAIMRITGDCPLLSPELCSEVLKAFKGNGTQYASNIEPRTFPKGMDCEVFSMNALYRADQESYPSEREHVTPWMRRAKIRRVNVRNPWKLEGRLTLDTEDDYKVICAAFNETPERLRAA